MTFDPTPVEVTCVTLSKDHCVQVPWEYINVCGYSDQCYKIPHTTYILHTTYRMSDHIVSYWTQFRRNKNKNKNKKTKNKKQNKKKNCSVKTHPYCIYLSRKILPMFHVTYAAVKDHLEPPSSSLHLCSPLKEIRRVKIHHQFTSFPK